MRRQKEPENVSPEIELVPTRRCERCGRRVFSKFGLKHGMGCVCYEKTHGTTEYARLRAQGQTEMPWICEESASL